MKQVETKDPEALASLKSIRRNGDTRLKGKTVKGEEN